MKTAVKPAVISSGDRKQPEQLPVAGASLARPLARGRRTRSAASLGAQLVVEQPAALDWA